MAALWVEAIGGAAATLTTLCWLPQTIEILRHKRTEGVSLIANLAFGFGQVLWMAYGIALQAWPVMIATTVTLVLVMAIVVLKLRYG